MITAVIISLLAFAGLTWAHVEMCLHDRRLAIKRAREASE